MVMLQNDKLYLCHKLNLNRIIDNDGKEHHNFECTHNVLANVQPYHFIHHNFPASCVKFQISS